MSDTEASIVILINRNGMGEADPALQQKLLQTYLALLIESPSLPAVIAFYGEGVRLVTGESPVLAPLRSLEAKGVRLVACSTCLNYYNLLDQVQVGIVGGMPDIIEAQWRAGKVITL
ncbi:MAG: DsrE family protein [Anaerolineales bacterium]|nr:DsrE family protein [Anaerolineales bacterium]